jgi:hypothetical protein
MSETGTSRRDPATLAIYRHSLEPNESAQVFLELPRTDSAGGAAMSNGVMRRVLPPTFSPTVRFVPWGFTWSRRAWWSSTGELDGLRTSVAVSSGACPFTGDHVSWKHAILRLFCCRPKQAAKLRISEDP